MDRRRANKFYNEICAILAGSGGLNDMLGWMAARGQSVVLDYGEETGQWEVSWITSGNRFTAVRRDVRDAVKDVIGQVRYDLQEKMIAGGFEG